MQIKSSKGIIVLKKKYLLQLRDNKKNIYFPNFWGLFGGRVGSNENFSEALKREIKEEINLIISIKKKIFSTTYDMIGLKKKRKMIYYECLKTKNTQLILKEGKKFGLFKFEELKNLRIVPLDFVAINTHYHYYNNFTSLYR
tara:strand:- start:409 stop:834 length:426 start_codon:yes stop_codon:yes gene_type:complete